MNKISKTKTIINAFTGPLPVNEPWYKARVNSCNTCPFSSLNKTDLSMWQELKDSVGGPFCTICGCFTDKKASQKEEECAMTEIGEVPRWKALAIKTASADDFNVYNNTPHIADLKFDPKAYVLDFGDLLRTESKQVELVFEGQHEVIGVDAGCWCTNISFDKLSDSMYVVRITLNGRKVKEGPFSKTAFVKYTKNRSATVRLIGNRKK